MYASVKNTYSQKNKMEKKEMPEYRMFRIRVKDHKKLKVLAAQRDESMLDTFSEALNTLTSIVGDWEDEARRLYIDQGNKIEAIKLCRRVTGLSIGAAKRAVEALKGGE